MNNDKTKTAEEILSEELQKQNHDNVFGRENSNRPGIEQYRSIKGIVIKAMEAYAEQKLLSKEEKMAVERLCSYAEIRRAANDYAQDQWKSQNHQIGSSVMIEYAQKDFIEGAMFVHKKLTSTGQQSENKTEQK